jgi:hypothetical protein
VSGEAFILDHGHMATDETRPRVRVGEALDSLAMAPLPAGTNAEAVFMLIKLDDGEWCARSVGDSYNRVEFLGQLTDYTHSLTVDEAAGWFEDGPE